MSGGMLTDAADQKLNACTPVPGACPLPFWLLWNVRVMQHKVGHGVLSVSRHHQSWMLAPGTRTLMRGTLSESGAAL